MEKHGFVLVHGYSGSPRDLAPLADDLAVRCGPEAVLAVRLPGHETGQPPLYYRERFMEAVAAGAEAMRMRGRRLVLVGHSTGGILALDFVLRHPRRTALLVLAATPHGLDGNALHRWERHRAGRPAIALGNVARMVSHTNRVTAAPPPGELPVCIVQGACDALVPPSDAAAWQRHGFSGSVASITLPETRHCIFTEPGGAAAADWIARQAENLLGADIEANLQDASRLAAMEGPRLQDFFQRTPQARRHLVRSPGARRALQGSCIPLPQCAPDPIQLNVEVTTRCSLDCPNCARTVHRREAQTMDESLFHYLLDLSPNAYRVILAGLGEPTLHPRLPALVEAAAARGRRAGLVTNAMHLTPALARALIQAGIAAVTFSLDAVDPGVLSAVRPGSQIDRILDHIRIFNGMAAPAGIATAVFSAVSADTIHHLPQLAEAVSSLGVRAWMLTDLNFDWNRSRALAAAQDAGAGYTQTIRQALRTAFSRSLPVLGVHGLEEFALDRRYRQFLLHPPALLMRRNLVHSACLSPWQTMPVDVAGNVTRCDCQPRAGIGNLRHQPFSEIWNGAAMQAWRRQMISGAPPAACQCCPRF
jgi:MoaA/NifB/PqqE/SkfB family radical SAM enzyme/pimeloyl-ACP methyl ester carboxylesterase